VESEVVVFVGYLLFGGTLREFVFHAFGYSRRKMLPSWVGCQLYLTNNASSTCKQKKKKVAVSRD
jgi:hypothetical protein